MALTLLKAIKVQLSSLTLALNQTNDLVRQQQQEIDAYNLQNSAQVSAISSLQQTASHGDTAWMLVATILVVMMTVPGLALFYGGLAQAPNVLSTVMQSFSIMCVVSFLWFAMGFSIAFSEGNAFMGNTTNFWLKHVDGHHVGEDNEKLYMVYQMTFAVISAAIICGSFAERMRYSAMLIFVAMWHLLVYCPVAHWAWGPGGFLEAAGCLDFAGGDVVHVSAGVSGLVASMLVGKRRSWSIGKELPPHNALLVFLGASLLWVGWFGFNAGSAFAADHMAINALAATQMAGACGGLSWMITEWIYTKRPSVVGIVSGSISGLVTITPSCGYVNQTGAVIIGAIGGIVCFFSIQLKHILGYDDALDAFGMHGIGGVVGCLLTGFFADKGVSRNEEINGAFYGKPSQIYIQLYGVVVIGSYCAVMTFILLKLLDLVMTKTLGYGIRCSPEEESRGLDISEHGESLVIDTSLFGGSKLKFIRGASMSIKAEDAGWGGVSPGQSMGPAEAQEVLVSEPVTVAVTNRVVPLEQEDLE